MTIHLNTLIIIGLCLLPGAVAVFILLGLLGAALDLELGSVALASTGAVITFAAGCALLLVGIGQQLGPG